MRIQTSLLVLAMLASTTASAAPKRRAPKAAKAKKAKAHMQKAAVASQAGRNEDALKELDAAYALDPQPMLLLARGHVYVKLDKCEDAIKLYEQYLATKPAKDLADATTDSIETCKATLAPPPPPPPPSIVTSEAINADEENPTLVAAKPGKPITRYPESSNAQVDAPASRSRFLDPILIGLGLGSALSIAGGVWFYTSARGKLDDAEAAASYGEWSSLVDDAQRLRLYSIICGAAGAVLVGGTVFYLARKGGDEQPRVTLIPTQRGGVIGYVGRF